jgi:hypothetical protein
MKSPSIFTITMLFVAKCFAQDITVHVVEDKTNKPISGVTLNLRTSCLSPNRPAALQQQTDASGVTVFHTVSLAKPPVCLDLFSITYSSLNLDYLFETPDQLKESGYVPISGVGNPVITTFPADVTFRVQKRTLAQRLEFLFQGP